MLACGEDGAVRLRLMTWNVGNPDADEPRYPWRLALQRYEDHVRDQIRARQPDVVLLQEVLPPAHCAGFVEADPARTCWDAAHREPQARRILGPDFTVVCDAGRHLECIGVRTSFGSIAGVAPAAFVLDGAATETLPLVACEPAACDDAHCDATASVATASVVTPHGTLRLVHVHLMAPSRSAAGLFWGAPCRGRQLQQAFERAAGGGGPTIMAGDFNLDPVRLIGDAEATLWQRHVGEGRRFADLTPQAPNGTQYGTRRGNLGIAVDHVLADGARGTCTVHGHGVGPDPGTEPLDGGFDWSTLPRGERWAGRIDHFAITCELVLEPAS